MDDKIKKSLKYSTIDGVFYSIMVGFGESFISAFAVFLKATNIQLGLLGSLPQALGSFLELFSNKLTGFLKSRKRLVCTSVFLQAFIYIPVILVFFMGGRRVECLILFMCLYWILGMIMIPGWTTWMGDLVHEKKRGVYFGRRNRISGFAAFVSVMAAGYSLNLFTDVLHNRYAGFAFIFCLALIARLFSFTFLAKQHEPASAISGKPSFSLIDYLKEARFRNHGLLILYLSFINFSVFVASPFFAAYMLYDLRLSYINFTIVNAAAIIAKNIFHPIWGKSADRFGTRRVLTLCGFLIPPVPVLWLFSKAVPYLVLIQVYAGFVWAGFEIASFNFILDTTSPEKRETCVAYYNVLNGTALFIGAMAGSILIKYNDIFWSKYLFVFLLSGILRLAGAFVFLPRLKEVREVERIPYARLFLSIITEMPTMGLIHTIITFRKKNGREGAQ